MQEASAYGAKQKLALEIGSFRFCREADFRAQRGSTVIRMPRFGRSVVQPVGSIGCPGTRRK
jgi:hypothetical protein